MAIRIPIGRHLRMQHSIWTACFRDEYICKYGKALINRKFPFPQMRKGKFDSIYLKSASPTAHEKSFTIPASFENASKSVQTGTQLHTCDKNWRWTAYPCHVLAAGLPEPWSSNVTISSHGFDISNISEGTLTMWQQISRRPLGNYIFA